MKTVIEQKDKHSVSLTIEIEAERAAAEYNKVCRKLSQRINIPGFRRGKAPRQVIEKNVGIEKIKLEVLERMLPGVFADAISEHQLDVVASPTVESYNYEPGKPIEVKAFVEIRPEVTLPELKELAVKVERFQVPADAVDSELQNLVRRLTTLESVIDRPAEATDTVNINFAGAVGGELIRGGSANHFQLDLAENNFIEGFAAQIVGHNVGEEFTINVKFPADYHDNTLKGKDAVFTIKINEIKRKVAPELNDETAKKIGPYENLDALKNDIQQLLSQRETEENHFRTQKALVEAYVAQVKVDLPESMIEREAQVLQNDIKERFKAQGLNWDQYAEQQGADTLMANFKKEAEQRLKTSLSFSDYAKKNNVTVSEAEYKAEVSQIAAMRGVDEKAIFRELTNNPGAIQGLLDQLVSQKVVEALMQLAKVEWVDAPKEPSDAESKKSLQTASDLSQENFEPATAG